MGTFNFEVGSSRTVVATINYSKLEMLQKGRILKPCDIIRIVEDAIECKLPQHDICVVDDKNSMITLYAHVNWVKEL